MSNIPFRHKLDSELNEIEFGEKLKKNVLDEVSNRQLFSAEVLKNDAKKSVPSGKSTKYSSLMNRIHLILNTELRIPVKPLFAVLFIVLSGLIYISFDATGISNEDIQKSQIEVSGNQNGGALYDIYKN
ncbi:hypothetical protein [Acetivibrio cellulolyticus]|uniref:hypothetical protein n=1 Tax=Acetivibrio cellulolyticus TaxID=35830 RepID=UPI0001E2F652|nr:hypothetical protein [Acetivibrio cellulolyticus]